MAGKSGQEPTHWDEFNVCMENGGIQPKMRTIKKESPKARAAFEVFERLGPERTLPAVAAETGHSLSTIRHWSSAHQWMDRLMEKADAIAEVQREAAKEVARTEVKQAADEWKDRQEVHRKEEWEMRQELLTLAKEAMRRWYDEAEKAPTLDSIAKLLELASKLGRLSSGLGTERTEVTGPDGGILQIEIRAALARVYGAVAEVPPIDVEASVVEVQRA